MKVNKIQKVILLGLLLIIPTSVFAIDLPAIANAYGEIVEGLLVKVVVGLVVLVMLMSAAYQMYENGNARPLKWAIAASIVMGGAVFFGESMIAYAGEVLNGFTGTNAAVTLS
jgi:chromate transport protein ChrA